MYFLLHELLFDWIWPPTLVPVRPGAKYIEKYSNTLQLQQYKIYIYSRRYKQYNSCYE